MAVRKSFSLQPTNESNIANPGGGVADAVRTVQTLPVSRTENFEQKRTERQQRKLADLKSKARAEAEEREREIAELFRAIERLVSGTERPGEGILALARELAQQWKIKKNSPPLFEGLFENNRLALLVALVVALREDHRLVARIRRYFPDELEKLSSRSLFAWLGDVAPEIFAARPKLSTKQRYEEERRWLHWTSPGLIELQFGGAMQAEVEKFPPTCLDNIFAGRGVTMQRLVELFAIDRHRLSTAAGVMKKGRLYNSPTVVKIMDFLLNESSRKKRKGPGRPKVLWPSDPDARTRVLSGMETRIKSLGAALLKIDPDMARQWQKEIADPFLDIVRRHRRQVGK